MNLTESQLDRYLHHIILKDIGGEGQRRLLAAKVLIVGAGGLGSPAALYLAAAGVGTIGICDDDCVELSNLQRQIIHSTKDIGRSKAESAVEKMRAINPDVRVAPHAERLTDQNAISIISDYDFVIDGTDNFPSKFLINDGCVARKKPYSHGGVVGFKGQVFTYVAGSLCLRCVFDRPPEPGCVMDCRGSGILGAAAGIIGAIQAAEAIKYILGRGDLLTNRILTVDALKMEFRTIPIERSQTCPTCGTHI